MKFHFFFISISFICSAICHLKTKFGIYFNKIQLTQLAEFYFSVWFYDRVNRIQRCLKFYIIFFLNGFKEKHLKGGSATSYWFISFKSKTFTLSKSFLCFLIACAMKIEIYFSLLLSVNSYLKSKTKYYAFKWNPSQMVSLAYVSDEREIIIIIIFIFCFRFENAAKR